MDDQRQVEQVLVADLKPYERNARTHGDKQVEMIADSIKAFGFNNPILIDESNGIIAGHGRYEAAKLLKLSSVPCLRLGHLSDAQKRAYVIADNRIALESNWDWGMLSKEVFDLSLTDLDLNLLGFDDKEFALIQSIDGQQTGKAGAGSASGGKAQGDYKVVIHCEDEEQQTELLERLLAEGLTCRAVM